MTPPLWIAVCGSGDPSNDDEAAYAVGAAIAEANAILVCGGRRGVMEAACKGAWENDGITVGLLPEKHRKKANKWLTVAVPTGIGGLGRSVLIVHAAHALIGIGGEYGTLSEITLALKADKPVVGLDTWTLGRRDGRQDDKITRVNNAAEAVTSALNSAIETRLRDDSV
jgi:uncharacterized protein (TIGR00725 family)